MITTILIFLFVLGLLIFVHEFGHFFTAKRSGVAVEEFGFGFPPRAWSRKKGDTVYSLNWVPLGGFVKIKGESGEDKSPGSFAAAAPWKRALIIIAGVTMNLVLTWVLLSAGFIFGIPQAIDEELQTSARIRNRTIQIVRVLPESPADQAEIKTGDAILEFDGVKPASLEAARNYFMSRAGQTIKLKLRRGKEIINKEAVPATLKETGQVGLGVGFVEVGMVSYPWYRAPLEGGRATAFLTVNVVLGFADVIRDAVMGRGVSVDLSGPVGIAVLTGEAAKFGLAHLAQFTALLSVNLAVINILPLPALDGGRLLFLSIETVRRRPVSPRLEAVVHRLGFALLLLLAFVVTVRDVSRFGGRIINALKSLVGL